MSYLLWYYMQYAVYLTHSGRRHYFTQSHTLDGLRMKVLKSFMYPGFVPPHWTVRSRMLPLHKQPVYRKAYFDLEIWEFDKRVWVSPDYDEIQRICFEEIRTLYADHQDFDSLGSNLK